MQNKLVKKTKRVDEGEKFKQVITEWINDENEKWRKLDEEMGETDVKPYFDMYSFHDYDDRVDFSFDGPLYEVLNNSDGFGWEHRDSLARKLSEAGLEWTPTEYSVWTLFKSSTKKSQPTFSEMVQKQRNKNRIQKSGGLLNELEELHSHLDKAWDELADALNLISDSAYPELQEFSNKCDEYCNAVGMLCLDVRDKLNNRM